MIDSNKSIKQENIVNNNGKNFSYRDDLKSLVKRYYHLMGYVIRENDGLVEVFEPQKKSPIFRFVFDRNSSIKYPTADLLTFNSKKLTDLIDLIINKGKIAKAYIPFEFETEKSFSSSLKNLISKSHRLGR